MKLAPEKVKDLIMLGPVVILLGMYLLVGASFDIIRIQAKCDYGHMDSIRTDSLVVADTVPRVRTAGFGH